MAAWEQNAVTDPDRIQRSGFSACPDRPGTMTLEALMSIANAIIAVHDAGWVATYEGGAHIEVSHRSAPGKAVDTVNVWDHEAGRRRIPFTIEAVNAEVAEWVSTYGLEYLTNVVAYLP